MPTTAPPPPSDAPQPTVTESASASREQVAAAAQLLEASRAVADLVDRVPDGASWEQRMISALVRVQAATLAVFVGANVAQDLATEGRRSTQAATTSTIAMRAAWLLLALVGMIGGGWGVNAVLDASERRAQLEEKASARAAAEAIDSGKPEAPRILPGGGGPAPAVLEPWDSDGPDEGVPGASEGP